MNLLRRLKERKVSVRKKNWTICRTHNGKTFFIHDIDEDTGAVKWSSAIHRAVRFRTERGCQLFLKKTIGGPKKDVYVSSIAGKGK